MSIMYVYVYDYVQLFVSRVTVFNTLTCDMTHVLHIIASIIMAIILCCVVVGLLALLKYLASGEVVGILDAIPSASLL